MSYKDSIIGVCFLLCMAAGFVAGISSQSDKTYLVVYLESNTVYSSYGPMSRKECVDTLAKVEADEKRANQHPTDIIVPLHVWCIP